MEKSELYHKAINGSLTDLYIYGDWYAGMEVFGLDYESAGNLTIGETEDLITEHKEGYSSVWENLTADWKRHHAFA